MRNVLHAFVKRQVERLFADWEAAGFSREEVLTILRDVYDDLAPRDEGMQTHAAQVKDAATKAHVSGR